MANLTEQWKKGELPDGWYWVEGSRAEGIYAYTAEYLNNMYRPRNGERIIEKAPSYKEWEDLKSKLQLKETAYDFDTARLEEENTKLKEELQNQAFILKSRESEIVKLKELLKRCKRIIEIDEYVSITGAGRDILWDLLQDLNQVLGE